MSINVLKELVTTWKAETEKGDELCKIHVYQDALAHYMNAMIAAELLIEHNEFAWGNGVPVPEWYYVSPRWRKRPLVTCNTNYNLIQLILSSHKNHMHCYTSNPLVKLQSPQPQDFDECNPKSYQTSPGL